MKIGAALEALQDGYSVQREGWNGPDQSLELQTPDDNSIMTLPYIFINTVDKEKVPWLASQTDILADDWTIL